MRVRKRKNGDKSKKPTWTSGAKGGGERTTESPTASTLERGKLSEKKANGGEKTKTSGRSEVKDGNKKELATKDRPRESGEQK